MEIYCTRMTRRLLYALCAAACLAAEAQETGSGSRRPRKAYTRALDIESVEHEPVVDEKPERTARENEPEETPFFELDSIPAPSEAYPSPSYRTEPVTPIPAPDEREMEDWKRSLVEDIVHRNSASGREAEEAEEAVSGWGWLDEDTRRFQEKRRKQTEEESDEWLDMNAPTPVSLFGDESESDGLSETADRNDSDGHAPDRDRRRTRSAYSRDADLDDPENADADDAAPFLYIQEENRSPVEPLDYSRTENENTEYRDGLLPITSDDESRIDAGAGWNESAWEPAASERRIHTENAPRSADSESFDIDLGNTKSSAVAWEELGGHRDFTDDNFEASLLNPSREPSSNSEWSEPTIGPVLDTPVHREHNPLRNEEAASREWERHWR